MSEVDKAKVAMKLFTFARDRIARGKHPFGKYFNVHYGVSSDELMDWMDDIEYMLYLNE